MTAVVQQRTQYSDLEVREALTTLAFFGGNSRRTSEETGISASTLRDWRSATHRELYLEICQQEGPKLEAIAADQARELILRSADVEHTLLDRLLDENQEEPLTSKELSELAGALQRITTSKGINTTKLLELTGRPTQIVQHLSPQEAIRGLARDLGITLDGTAEELPSISLTTGSDEANART